MPTKISVPVIKPVAPAPVVVGEDVVVPLKGLKKTMVKTMTAALLIPHFGLYEEIDVTRLVALRTDLKHLASLRGVRFSYMPVFLKVSIFCCVHPTKPICLMCPVNER